MNKEQSIVAKKAMSDWLSSTFELGKAPSIIDCTYEFDLHELHYYVFRFKKNLLSKWLLGVCGGYEKNELEHCGHVFSEFKDYNDVTAYENAIEIVEKIRVYWMNQSNHNL
ncbi:MAG TPA: hypothetical protein VFH18_02345 [Erysipelotrichaceae bacterium]|nr:hypothetical protein [Erysipelotrichaceae bacterium]